VFYIDIAKVDRYIAHVAMVFSSVYLKCFIYFRRMLKVFHLDVAYTCMLQAYISSVSDVLYVCYKCFTWMLYIFCNGYKCVFLVLQMYVTNVSTVSDVCYKVFHLDVAKLVLVLQMLQWDLLPQPPASTALPTYMRVGAEGA
jgi:hypothetical protein